MPPSLPRCVDGGDGGDDGGVAAAETECVCWSFERSQIGSSVRSRARSVT